MKKITISGSIRRRLAALLLAAAACAGVTGAYAEAVSVIRPGAATPSEAEKQPAGSESSGAAELLPPSGSESSGSSGSVELLPPSGGESSGGAELLPPSGGESSGSSGSTAPSVSQFKLKLTQENGKITAKISSASEREVEITISLEGSRVQTLSLIGNGSVASGTLEAGVYTVRAEYVTPAEGVSAVTKTIEVEEAQQQAPVQPTVAKIGATVAVSGDTITVTVTNADNYPLYAAVGDEIKEVVHGKATFSGLSDGEYDVEVDYITAVPGVSPYRTSVTVGSGSSGSGATQTKKAITITLVVPGEKQIVVCGTAEPNTDVTLSTKPTSKNTIVRADASGAYAGVIKCEPGTYTGVYAKYGKDISTRVAARGTYTVTGEPSTPVAPAEKPPLTVDPIYSSTLKVIAYSTPGTLVNLGVKGYGQTVTADKNGALVYSLPQTYANGTVVTFTVFYGEDNKLTYTFDVVVGAASNYRTLMKGSYGDDVLALTERLKQLGYDIKPSKTYTVDTAEVVRQFQRLNGLDVDGMAGKNTQTRLYSINAIGPGSAGTNTGYGSLSRSTRYNAAVVPMQKRLRELGYPVGKVDGYFGSQTYRAVVYFQRINGLTPADGVADSGTLALLYSASAKRYNGTTAGTSASTGEASGYRLLYWGSKGEYVRRLQSALLAAGYKQVKVADGIYGKWTYDAVIAFQKDNGLMVDGIAGKQTQNKLYGTSY